MLTESTVNKARDIEWRGKPLVVDAEGWLQGAPHDGSTSEAAISDGR